MADDLLAEALARLDPPTIIVTRMHPTLGYPWGWGAVTVEQMRDPWVCHDCRGRKRAGTGRHLMPDGSFACTPCARRRCERNGVKLPPHRPGPIDGVTVLEPPGEAV